jgi:hypothetical protein
MSSAKLLKLLQLYEVHLVTRKKKRRRSQWAEETAFNAILACYEILPEWDGFHETATFVLDKERLVNTVKVMRIFGFIQGVMMVQKILKLEDVNRHNHWLEAEGNSAVIK